MGTPADIPSIVLRWRIHVVLMQHVRTQLILTHAYAIKARTLLKKLLRLKRFVPILMNVQIILTIVVLMLVALIMMEVLAVCVMLDIMVTAFNVRMTMNVIWASARNTPIV